MMCSQHTSLDGKGSKFEDFLQQLPRLLLESGFSSMGEITCGGGVLAKESLISTKAKMLPSSFKTRLHHNLQSLWTSLETCEVYESSTTTCTHVPFLYAKR